MKQSINRSAVVALIVVFLVFCGAMGCNMFLLNLYSIDHLKEDPPPPELIEFQGKIYRVDNPWNGPNEVSIIYLPSRVADTMVGDSLGYGINSKTGKKSNEIFECLPCHGVNGAPWAYLMRYGNTYKYLTFYRIGETDTIKERLAVYEVFDRADIKEVTVFEEMQTNNLSNKLIDMLWQDMVNATTAASDVWDCKDPITLLFKSYSRPVFWMELDVDKGIVRWAENCYRLSSEIAKQLAVYRDKWHPYEYIQDSVTVNDIWYNVVEFGGHYQALYQLPDKITKDQIGQLLGYNYDNAKIYEYLPYKEIAPNMVCVLETKEGELKFLYFEMIANGDANISIHELLAIFGVTKPEDITEIYYGEFDLNLEYDGDRQGGTDQVKSFSDLLFSASEGSHYGQELDINLRFVTKNGVIFFGHYSTKTGALKIGGEYYQLNQVLDFQLVD